MIIRYTESISTHGSNSHELLQRRVIVLHDAQNYLDETYKTILIIKNVHLNPSIKPHDTPKIMI